MPRIRVLFADDQFPYDETEQNASVKKAIVKEIGDKLKAEGEDPEYAFSEDFKWFQGLRQHLGERFEVIPARTFAEAKNYVLHKSDKFDAAVIDLSWYGDADLSPGERKNRGIELLEILQEYNEKNQSFKPVLAFSQNFKDDLTLMSLALDRGALPVPKADSEKADSETGYQALSSAISYLTKVRPLGSRIKDPAVMAALVNKTGAIITTLIKSFAG